MPVLRKRNHWHGLALECLRRTRTRFSALCYAVCYLVHHRHNKPRLRPIRCHSWRVDSTLSTFASLCLYSTTLFGRKTCKVSKEKAGQSLRLYCHSSFFGFFSLPQSHRQRIRPPPSSLMTVSLPKRWPVRSSLTICITSIPERAAISDRPACFFHSTSLASIHSISSMSSISSTSSFQSLGTAIVSSPLFAKRSRTGMFTPSTSTW